MNEELRQEFLNETIDSLKRLQKDSQTQSAETLSEEFLRHLFRQIHTFKGTAQTFGFNSFSQFAHEFESLIQAINTNRIYQSRETSFLIKEFLNQLLNLCLDEDATVSTEISNKFDRLIPTENRKTSHNYSAGKIPENYLSKLSVQENNLLKNAVESGSLFYLIEAFFDSSDFNNGFINFRRILDENGEIIAVSPSEKSGHGQEIGFRFFYVTALKSSEVFEIIKPFKAQIDFESNSSNKKSGDLADLLSNSIADVEKKAQRLNKKVSFEVFNETNHIARKNLILINSLLVHLLRNAIDHAIESPEERISIPKPPTGKIIINIFEDKNNLILRIEDDGRGIDAEKITAQAKKRGIISETQNLDQNETLNLIFAHGLSTSEAVSDISGRGIGLDAVRDLIEKAGGKIKVETEINRGTLFEIQLPL